MEFSPRYWGSINYSASNLISQRLSQAFFLHHRPNHAHDCVHRPLSFSIFLGSVRRMRLPSNAFILKSLDTLSRIKFISLIGASSSPSLAGLSFKIILQFFQFGKCLGFCLQCIDKHQPGVVIFYDKKIPVSSKRHCQWSLQVKM